jgi:hypothetical protein
MSVSQEQHEFDEAQLETWNKLSQDERQVWMSGFLKLPALPKWVQIGDNGALYYYSTRNPTKKNYFSRKLYELLLVGQLPHCIENCNVNEIVAKLRQMRKHKGQNWTVEKYRKFIRSKLQKEKQRNRSKSPKSHKKNRG